MLRSRPVTTYEELQNLIADIESSLGAINVNIFNGLGYFNLLLEKYTDNMNRVQSHFIDATGLSQDTYRRLRGYKQVGKIGDDTLMRAAYGLGTSYEEAMILFLAFGKYVLCDDPMHRSENMILFELNKLYGHSDSSKRMARLDELVGEYDFQIR